jgi:UDP-glucose 4-epimerase
MSSRRILITGISSSLGGRLAQRLELDPQVQTLVGVDTSEPQHRLERTEFVRVDTEQTALQRILSAAAIDTVVDTRLVPDPLVAASGSAHEINVAGTAEVLLACGAPGCAVRKLVFKSSANYYGFGSQDPAFWSEDVDRRRPPGNGIERDVVEAEERVREFAGRDGARTVTTLRLADQLGGEERASHLALLSLPVVPAILGFDPRWQFIHEHDAVGALAHAVLHEIPGTYNAAADGVLALSEIASLLGKITVPLLPPVGTGFAAAQLRRLGMPVPVELVRQLRAGRGLDNRRLKATGYVYRYTSREAVLKLRAQQRLRPLLGSGGEGYRYEPEVEEFLRRSPSVRPPVRLGADASDPDRPNPPDADGSPAPGAYDSLSADEVIGIAGSLDPPALAELRRHEAATRSRRELLGALDAMLERAQNPG